MCIGDDSIHLFPVKNVGKIIWIFCSHLKGNWEEMGLCLFIQNLWGHRSVGAEGLQPQKQVSSAGDTDEASGSLFSLKTLERPPGWEGGKVSSHPPSIISCLHSASACWGICKDAGGEQQWNKGRTSGSSAGEGGERKHSYIREQK